MPLDVPPPQTAGSAEAHLSALMAAIQAGRLPDIQEWVAKDPSLLARRNAAGLSPITLAAYMEKPDLVAFLASKRGKPDFFEALILGEAGVVREALARGQDVNAFSPDGFTPLGLAVFFRQPALARMLLDAGADPNLVARNALRTGPIHAAVARGDHATLALLLERGANPDTAQTKLVRPIHDAAASGNTAAVALLLMFGADPRARTEEGHTAADLAKQKGFEALARQLASRLE